MGKRTIWWEVKTLCENLCWHWAMISECNVVISKIERCHYTGMQYAFIDNFFFIIAIIFLNLNFNCKLPLKKFWFSFIPIAEFCQLQERHSHVTHLSGPASPNMSPPCPNISNGTRDKSYHFTSITQISLSKTWPFSPASSYSKPFDERHLHVVHTWMGWKMVIGSG